MGRENDRKKKPSSSSTSSKSSKKKKKEHKSKRAHEHASSSSSEDEIDVEKGVVESGSKWGLPRLFRGVSARLDVKMLIVFILVSAIAYEVMTMGVSPESMFRRQSIDAVFQTMDTNGTPAPVVVVQVADSNPSRPINPIIVPDGQTSSTTGNSDTNAGTKPQKNAEQEQPIPPKEPEQDTSSKTDGKEQQMAHRPSIVTIRR